MTDKTPLLLFGYKCKAPVKNKFPIFVTATYLTTKNQEDFINWWHSEIAPIIDKKIDYYKSKQKEG